MEKHISNRSFRVSLVFYCLLLSHYLTVFFKKVLVYNGIKRSGWISPTDLNNYDVVLTDYNIMKSEIHYAESNKPKMAMRLERRFIIPTSPLTMTNWWRVVLDEAQMVETPTNSCSKMVKSLPGTTI